MKKIQIIIIREYLIRVKSKTFLLSTLLTPLAVVAIAAVAILASTWKEDEQFEIHLQDKTGIFTPMLEGKKGELSFSTQLPNGTSLTAWLQEDKNRGYLIIDSTFLVADQPRAEIQSSGNIPISLKSTLEDTLTKVIRKIRLTESGITQEQMKRINQEVKLKTLKVTEEGTERSSTGIAAMLGYVMGILIYIFMFSYGMIVMRGVIEEKTNRIVEVIISSVRPFQLMIGKILAIAAVGLTQFLIWIILLVGISAIAMPMISGDIQATQQVPGELQNMQGMQGMQEMQDNLPSGDQNQLAEEISAGIRQFDFSLIFYFIFYFLGGYLLYGSLFAAVGSAVDQESDAQQLIWPITIPLVIPMMLLGTILQQPDGSVAIFCSIFPFFSPVCMMVRLASIQVPWYEIVASMISLILTFLIVIWLAGRIYRTGIFMYGKKPSIKEVIRWVFS
jgi:ABC-2 type transport system permease protein